MSDFLDKLNVLLRAGLNSLLSGGTERSSTGKVKISPDNLGKDVDREIAALRKQIDTAMGEEDRMKAQIESLRKQAADSDEAADRSLEQGNDAQARQILQRMRELERKANQMAAELDRHQQATFDLIQHVNTLEAMVSDARHQQEEQAQQAPVVGEMAGDVPPEAAEAQMRSQQPDRPAGNVLSDMLRGVRERVEGVITPQSTQQQAAPAEKQAEATTAAQSAQTAQPAQPAQTTQAPPTQGNVKVKVDRADVEIEEDLAKRRARLSKPE